MSDIQIEDVAALFDLVDVMDELKQTLGRYTMDDPMTLPMATSSLGNPAFVVRQLIDKFVIACSALEIAIASNYIAESHSKLRDKITSTTELLGRSYVPGCRHRNLLLESFQNRFGSGRDGYQLNLADSYTYGQISDLLTVAHEFFFDPDVLSLRALLDGPFMASGTLSFFEDLSSLKAVARSLSDGDDAEEHQSSYNAAIRGVIAYAEMAAWLGEVCADLDAEKSKEPVRFLFAPEDGIRWDQLSVVFETIFEMVEKSKNRAERVSSDHEILQRDWKASRRQILNLMGNSYYQTSGEFFRWPEGISPIDGSGVPAVGISFNKVVNLGLDELRNRRGAFETRIQLAIHDINAIGSDVGFAERLAFGEALVTPELRTGKTIRDEVLTAHEVHKSQRVREDGSVSQPRLRGRYSPYLGDTAPDFSADTTEGRIDFHDWIGDSWCLLVSHPKDFTPVGTTEMGYIAGLKPEFDKRNCKIIGLSIDPVSDHTDWSRDIEETQGHAINFPLIGDSDGTISKIYGILPTYSGSGEAEGRLADIATVRSLFLIGPDKKIWAYLVYPISTGRNFDEVLRLLDSCQLTARHKVATPVNWKQGDDVIIVPAVSDEEAKEKFAGGWKAPKPYLRIVRQPED